MFLSGESGKSVGGGAEPLHRWKASLVLFEALGFAAVWKSVSKEGRWTVECNDAARASLGSLGAPDRTKQDGARLLAWLERQPDHLFELATDSLWIWRSGQLPVRKWVGLSPREEEVAALMLAGKTAEEAALLLSISRRTVEKHIQHVYTKTGVSSRKEFFRKAISNTNDENLA